MRNFASLQQFTTDIQKIIFIIVKSISVGCCSSTSKKNWCEV